MFENITFHDIVLEKPSRENESIEIANYQVANEDDLTQYYQTPRENMKFLLEGRAKTLLPMPLSTYARDNLLYMQVFSLYDASGRMYTQRKNFPYYLLLYTYEGKGILKYEGKTYSLSQGDGFLIDCRKEHMYKSDNEHWKHALLHYAGHTSDWLYQQFSTDCSPVFHLEHSGKFQNNLEKLLVSYQKISPYREYSVSMYLQKLLLNLIEDRNTARLNVPDYIRYLERYLQCNFKNQLTLDELANFAGISKYHLEREFKKYTGYSIMNYLIELRVNHACFLLLNTNLSIRIISEESGFSDYPNFLKLFKSRMKTTPGKYRTPS